MTMDDVLSTTFIVVTTLVVITNPQKVAPGVNPNNYQPPPQQQYQPPPPPPQQVQYQQQPIQSAIPQEMHHQQQQPPPPPPPQQQQQHQQPPPPPPQQQAQHGHHDHHGQPQLLNTANLAEEREHMQEHLNVNIDTSKMTEQELQFHYFKMHDADNNNKLDGCELIKSLIHWHENDSEAQIIRTDDELSEAADNMLGLMDSNLDGYIEWYEFLAVSSKSTDKSS